MNQWESMSCPRLSYFGLVLDATDGEDLDGEKDVVGGFDVGVFGLPQTVEVEFVQVESGSGLANLKLVWTGADAVVLLESERVVLAVDTLHFALDTYPMFAASTICCSSRMAPGTFFGDRLTTQTKPDFLSSIS